jgi:hypothetical protein
VAQDGRHEFVQRRRGLVLVCGLWRVICHRGSLPRHESPKLPPLHPYNSAPQPASAAEPVRPQGRSPGTCQHGMRRHRGVGTERRLLSPAVPPSIDSNIGDVRTHMSDVSWGLWMRRNV